MSGGNWTVPILARIAQLKADGKFYEYHQYFRTAVNKLKRRKEYSFGREILISGVSHLLSNDQFDSGIDLANLLIELYTLEGNNLTRDDLDIFTSIIQEIKVDSEARTLFINKVTDLFHNSDLIDSLNLFLCRYFWEEGAFVRSRYRVLLSNNGIAAGLFLIQYHTEYGLLSEIDLFITQAVLQFLCLKKETLAAEAFHTYVKNHPNIKELPPSENYPLLNFIWFILICILNQEDARVFLFLRKKYENQIKRDCSFSTYLDDIGTKYFNLKPASSSRGKSPLDNLLGLFGGMDDLFGDVLSEPSGSNAPKSSLCIEEVE